MKKTFLILCHISCFEPYDVVDKNLVIDSSFFAIPADDFYLLRKAV